MKSLPRRSAVPIPLFVLAAGLAAWPALALEDVSLPAELPAPQTISVDVTSAPSTKVTLARPAKRVCFFARSTDAAVDAAKIDVRAWGDEGMHHMHSSAPIAGNTTPTSGCFDDVGLTFFVSATPRETLKAKAAKLELALFYPGIDVKTFYFPRSENPRYLVDAFPAMATDPGSYADWLSANHAAADAGRRRVFLAAPRSAFRFLKFDLKPGDVGSPQVSALPVKDEPALAFDGDGGEERVIFLDGQRYRLKSDFVTQEQPASVKLPVFGRRGSGAAADAVEIDTARVMADAGAAPAKQYVAAWEKHDACYRKEWDKLDPNGMSHHFIVVSTGGSSDDLDAIVDKKVRKACKSAAAEKQLLGLAKKVVSARADVFKRTTDELGTRLASAQER